MMVEKLEWVKTENGVLKAKGYPLFIKFQHDDKGSFVLYHGPDAMLLRCVTLDYAKSMGARILGEMIEIGVVEFSQ